MELFYPAESNDVSAILAKFTVNYTIQNSYNNIMLGNGLMDIWFNIIVLLSIGAVGMILGSIIISKKEV